MKKSVVLILLCLIVAGIAWVVYPILGGPEKTAEIGLNSPDSIEAGLPPQDIAKNVPVTAPEASAEPIQVPVTVPVTTEVAPVDDLDIKALRDQINKERDIHQQIKLRRLELERANLQLEQEKALVEVHQLRKNNQGVVRDPNGEGTTMLPDIKVVFIGQSERSADAIITVNGTNYSIKPGDKPQDNILVKSISDKGVVVLVNGKSELTLIPNLME